MTRPIRNTGPCFPSGLPRQRGQRDLLSHTEFYTPIICMLSVFQAIPFELPRKPPTVNRWDSTLGTPGGDKYYNQYRPQCEVCPRDHGKVVESLRGRRTVILRTSVTPCSPMNSMICSGVTLLMAGQQTIPFDVFNEE